MLASLWTLEEVINAILACRILVQFLGQNAGLMYYRRTHPERRMPFRMWLYPLPCWIAFAGWSFIYRSKLIGQRDMPFYKQEALLGLVVIATGVAVFLAWSAGRGNGHFGESLSVENGSARLIRTRTCSSTWRRPAGGSAFLVRSCRRRPLEITIEGRATTWPSVASGPEILRPTPRGVKGGPGCYTCLDLRGDSLRSRLARNL